MTSFKSCSEPWSDGKRAFCGCGWFSRELPAKVTVQEVWSRHIRRVEKQRARVRRMNQRRYRRKGVRRTR